jgi:hypothetical protein
MNSSHFSSENSYISKELWTDFLASYLSFWMREKCSWNKSCNHKIYSVTPCFTLSDTAVPDSSSYSFMPTKQKHLFRCACWLQDLSINFMEATLSSDVNKVMPLPCIEKLNYFRLFKISAGYASCCKQEKSEKSVVINYPFKDRKKSRFFI